MKFRRTHRREGGKEDDRTGRGRMPCGNRARARDLCGPTSVQNLEASPSCRTNLALCQGIGHTCNSSSTIVPSRPKLRVFEGFPGHEGRCGGNPVVRVMIHTYVCVGMRYQKQSTKLYVVYVYVGLRYSEREGGESSMMEMYNLQSTSYNLRRQISTTKSFPVCLPAP